MIPPLALKPPCLGWLFPAQRVQWSFVLLPLCVKEASPWLTHRLEAGLCLPKFPRPQLPPTPAVFHQKLP